MNCMDGLLTIVVCIQEAIMDPAKPGSVDDKVQDQMEAGKSEVRPNSILERTFP